MDDHDAPTQLYEKAHWLKPVMTRDELPVVDVPEAAQCFVSSTGEIFRFAGGTWELVDEEDD